MHWIYYIVREADLGHALWNRFWINGLNFSHGIYYIISFYLLMSLLLTDNDISFNKNSIAFQESFFINNFHFFSANVKNFKLLISF